MSMTAIEHIEVGSGGAASIEFTSIPADHTDLMILLSGRAGAASTTLELNGSSSGFSYTRLYAVPSVGSSSAAANALTQISNPTSFTANTFSNSQIYFPNYRSGSAKSYSVEGTTENNSTTFFMNLLAGLWTGTDPITSITLQPTDGESFVQYTSATLYGITAGSDGTTTVS